MLLTAGSSRLDIRNVCFIIELIALTTKTALPRHVFNINIHYHLAIPINRSSEYLRKNSLCFLIEGRCVPMGEVLLFPSSRWTSHNPTIIVVVVVVVVAIHVDEAESLELPAPIFDVPS